MQRREFIVGLGAAITGSIQTDAQELPSVPLVGYLDDGPAEGFIFRQNRAVAQVVTEGDEHHQKR
jgi:hypothetical protein